MAYTNKHLIEVVCGFQFTQEPLNWDSTYFGQLYEKIKVDGFTEKQERKGFQIEVSPNSLDASKPVVSAGQTSDDQVVFKNLKKGWAISMGKNKVSFHIVKDYTKWEDFRDQLIIPFYKIYLSIGLGKGRRQCNVLYLNNFTKPIEESLANYFTIISSLGGEFGTETGSFVQRVFNDKKSNLLITKLNSQTIPGNNINIINLECASVCISEDLINGSDWISQVNATHAPVQAFFETIITDNLRKEL
jgi:uncharacterized protein (TIGR04255 family)